MSKIVYVWREDAPLSADVYSTRRGNTTHTVPRYWDGSRWWALKWKAKGAPVKTFPILWNKASYEPKPQGNAFGTAHEYHAQVISGQDGIRWGERVRVFDDKEILDFAIADGYLPDDFRGFAQEALRNPIAAKVYHTVALTKDGAVLRVFEADLSLEQAKTLYEREIQKLDEIQYKSSTVKMCVLKGCDWGRYQTVNAEDIVVSHSFN